MQSIWNAPTTNKQRNAPRKFYLTTMPSFGRMTGLSRSAPRERAHYRRLVIGSVKCAIITAACWLIASAAPALAACLEMPPGVTLEVEAKVGKPSNEIVEALLHDAEKIYTDGAQIVGQRPRTEAQSHAIPDKDFHIEECHFHNAFSSVPKELPDKLQWTLIRIEQFDNFIFDAVGAAATCSNTEAGLRLELSRELLDHALMEFKGDTKERDWNPNLNWPETHERCTK